MSQTIQRDLFGLDEPPAPPVAGLFADVVFDRPLGIRRNVVVLPSGYELIGCSVPAIVSTQPDGRLRVSMLNDRDDQLPVKITGRRLP